MKMFLKKISGNYFKLTAGVVSISFSPLAVKLVAFAPSVSAFYRSFYAAGFFLLCALARQIIQKGDKAGPANFRWVIPSVLAGVFLGLDLIVWHRTILYVGAGPATFLGNSQILFVTLFAVLVFKERVPKLFYLVLALVLIGLYLLIPLTGPGVSQQTGYLLGLIVGFTYAGMLICLRYAKTLAGRLYPELWSLCVLFLASSAVIFVSAQFVEGTAVAVWDVNGHILMALTALFCQTFGWYMINSSIIKIPAHEGSLILMLQPLLATIWGCLFFLEPLSAVQISGIILTLAGIIWYQTSRKTDSIQSEIEAKEIL
jgi:drug/metabolite transporter (DMT)-like permease